MLRPAAEGAATGEGISREAELVIAGLREELSQTMADVVARAVAQEMAKLRHR